MPIPYSFSGHVRVVWNAFGSAGKHRFRVADNPEQTPEVGKWREIFPFFVPLYSVGSHRNKVRTAQLLGESLATGVHGSDLVKLHPSLGNWNRSPRSNEWVGGRDASSVSPAPAFNFSSTDYMAKVAVSRTSSRVLLCARTAAEMCLGGGPLFRVLRFCFVVFHF